MKLLYSCDSTVQYHSILLPEPIELCITDNPKCFILFYILPVVAFCLLIPEDNSQFHKIIPEVAPSLSNLSITAMVSRNMHKLSARHSVSH